VAADPLPGLAHPGVAATVLNRLGDTGFTLLYHLTGQVVSDDGEVVPHYEEEHFDSLLELFLCVVAPRLGVYHKQLLANDYDEVVMAAAATETSGKGARRAKNKKTARRREKEATKGSNSSNTESREELDEKVGAEEALTAEVPASVRVPVPLEQSSFYRTSIGPTSAAHVLGAGRLLLPHELTQPHSQPFLPSRARKTPSHPISDTIDVSLLRFVTESVKPELLTLWHAVDNMLSLIATTVDNADRLAALVRGMFVWMTVDEATITFPPTEGGAVGSTYVALGSLRQQVRPLVVRNKSKQRLKKGKKGSPTQSEEKQGNVTTCTLAAHWHPWSVVAAASSQQVNLSQLYRKHQLKALRRHGDSSAVKFLVASQMQQSMQQMLVENLNVKHDLHGPHCLPPPKRILQEVPQRFLAVCRIRGEGLSCLLDSDSRDPRENLLTTHLGFLLRVPWVLEDQQRMDVALNTLHDGVQDRERLRERDRVRGRAAEAQLRPDNNPFRDIEIHLNRFTEPPVWAESVLQQLQLVVKAPLTVGESLRASNNLYRSELSVLYQGEAGMGPGPIKELLEMCRLTLLQVHQISATSLQEDVPQTSSPSKESGELTRLHDAKVSGNQSGNVAKNADKKRNVRRSSGRKGVGVSQLPLHSIFPLFRPAGDSYPEAVVPLEVDAVVRKMLQALPPGSLTPANRDRQQAQARHIALSLFESVGVVLGFSVRNSCPMGLGMPQFIWKMLLQQAAWSNDDSPLSKERGGMKNPVLNGSMTVSYSTETIRSAGAHHAGRGGGAWQRQEQQEHVSWEQLVGQDDIMLRSLQDVLSLPADDLAALDLDFVGAEMEWNAVAGRLELIEVPLLAGSATRKTRKTRKKHVHDEQQGQGPQVVTTENRQQYVELYTKRRYCPPSMRASVQAIRRGLLRVIPQELIDIMSGPHIGEYLMGDVEMNLADMRMMVQYEDYSEQHRVIKLFWRMLEQDFSELERRSLLLFWTGSSVPPRGGFSVDAEYDEMTISKLSSPRGSEKRTGGSGCALLPEASTCDKHLFLPEYASADEMRRAIRSALKHSSMGFDKP